MTLSLAQHWRGINEEREFLRFVKNNHLPLFPRRIDQSQFNQSQFNQSQFNQSQFNQSQFNQSQFNQSQFKN